MKRAVTALLSAMIVASPVAAGAACVQADLAGAWRAYMVYGNSTVRCTLVVQSGGAVADTACRISASNKPLTLTDGQVTIASAPPCTFTGAFKLGGSQQTLDEAALARDKIT